MANRVPREEFLRKKELDAKRQKGELPPEKDAEGNLINPHVPEFMSKAPWYMNQDAPTLSHQRLQKKEDSLGIATTYKRGRFIGRATRFRKGACENCGAMTHTKKDCLYRPRRVGAWKTGEDIQPDEVLPSDVTLGYAGKRDRYLGYDPEEHKHTIEKFNKAEAERKNFREEQRLKELEEKRKAKEEERKADAEKKKGEEDGEASSSASDSDTDTDTDTDDSDSEDSDDELREKEVSQDGRVRLRSHNLRQREDTAKYLYNLDVDSAYYDPKTRSMRANPNPHLDPSQAAFMGDNFVRISGESVNFAQSQLFAWEAYNKGSEVHLQANPTQVELLKKKFAERKEELEKKKQQSVLEKYGGKEHLKAPPKELLLGASEAYVEYARDGTVIKGAEPAIPKSRYEEDVYINNHTSVWGSYYDIPNRAWGFACCKQTMKNSWCTAIGQKEEEPEPVGKARTAVPSPPAAKAASPAKESALAGVQLGTVPAEEGGAYTRIEQSIDKSSKKSKKKSGDDDDDMPPPHRSASSWGAAGTNDDIELDPKKLKRALRKLEKEEKRQSVRDERKRGYNSISDSINVSAEEMEAYRMKRQRAEDPMLNYKG